MRYYNVQEAAVLIGCHERHIRHLISTGKLQANKVERSNHCGYLWMIPEKNIEDFKSVPQVQGWKRGRPRNE